MTTRSIMDGQKKQVLGFVKDAIKKATFHKDAMQRLTGNGGVFLEDVTATLIKHSVADDRFGLFTSFELTVPRGYDHGTQLATFASYAKKEKFFNYNDAIMDKNFSKATQRLVPGKTYSVKIFGIKQGQVVTSDDCLAFLVSQRAILVGAQGVSLTRQLKKYEFPIGKWTVSFDEKDALFTDADGYHRVPVMNQHSDGDWEFRLGYFEGGWYDIGYLLCFCDLSA